MLVRLRVVIDLEIGGADGLLKRFEKMLAWNRLCGGSIPTQGVGVTKNKRLRGWATQLRTDTDRTSTFDVDYTFDVPSVCETERSV